MFPDMSQHEDKLQDCLPLERLLKKLLVELESSGPTDLDRLGVQAGAVSETSRHRYAQMGEGNAQGR